MAEQTSFLFSLTTTKNVSADLFVSCVAFPFGVFYPMTWGSYDSIIRVPIYVMYDRECERRRLRVLTLVATGTRTRQETIQKRTSGRDS